MWPDVSVIIPYYDNPAGLRAAFTVGALLPDSFGPDNLGAAPGGTDGG